VIHSQIEYHNSLQTSFIDKSNIHLIKSFREEKN